MSLTTPWQANTYIPQNSLIYVTCNSERDQGPHWLILLANKTAAIDFDYLSSAKLLNDRGIYKIEQQTNVTLRLLINSTESNNGTMIQCNDANTGGRISETTIIIPGMFMTKNWNIIIIFSIFIV